MWNDDARKLFCPFGTKSTSVLNDSRPFRCQAEKCMAWNPAPDNVQLGDCLFIQDMRKPR